MRPDYLDRRIDFKDPGLALALDELSFWSSRFGSLIFRHLELRPNINVLDLACGTGFPLIELAQCHGTSCRFTGLDPWPQALSRALLKARFYGVSNVSLARGDGAHMPFAGSQFDLIVSNLGINNFDDAPAVFRECSRVARKGARIVLTSNIKGHMQQIYDLYRQTLIDLGKTDCLPRLAVNEDHRGTQESICAMLEDCGFRIHRVLVDPFVMRYVDGTALFRHSLTRLGFLDGWRNILDPNDENMVFGELERRLNEVAAREGEVRMTVPMLYVEGVK
jgi:ubiquinone/menaquinone biosynthesis C-methylase UbiE